MSKLKKESGAQGRKRRATEIAESRKASASILSFFTAPSAKTTRRDKSDDSEDDVVCSGTEADQFDAEESEIEERKPEVELGIDLASADDTPSVLSFHDVGYLNFDPDTRIAIIQSSVQNEMIARGPFVFQNKDSRFPITNGRSMQASWFSKSLANGSRVNRSWLLYSPVSDAAYCFPCLLFSSAALNVRSAFELKEGFSKWRKSERVLSHENMTKHRQAFGMWKESERRLLHQTGVDSELQKNFQQEKQKWRDILTRLLDCVKYLASQNLAFRGHDESLCQADSHNPGNFLALLDLLAKYDPVLNSHMSYVRANPHSVSYLSPAIQNEFIDLLASSVRQQLLNDIKRNRYYGMLYDSTPDLAHREQMSQVIRFVDVDFEKKDVTIRESFLGFIDMHSKDAAATEDAILNQLDSQDLPLENCRCQCYDNAAVMSGHVSGVQKRITDGNPLALFINCDNHSLNLAGVHASSQEALAVTFFGTIDGIYNFFSRSTVRWHKLKDALKVTVKRECDTRWSARQEAVEVVFEHIDELVTLLEDMTERKQNTAETCADAQQLLDNILTYNFMCLLHFWDNILRRINRVQKRLQDPTMNFREAAADIEALQTFFCEHLDDICERAVSFGQSNCEKLDIQIERRVRRRRRLPGETARYVGLSAEQEMNRSIRSILDRLTTDMTDRFSRLKDLNCRFGFLLDTKSLLQAPNLDDDSDTELRTQCLDFGKVYHADENGNELFQEVYDCRLLLKERYQKGSDVEQPGTPLELLRFIISYGDDVFPNFRIALQMLLTVSVSIASCERSFSKLKLILTYVRSSMHQNRLNNLTLLSIEKEKLNCVDFATIIDDFASLKARRVNF